MSDVMPVLITGGFTAFGWYATYLYAKKREDSTRRLDLLLKFRARQIEELYGPLLSLIEQIFNVDQVQANVLHGAPNLAEDQQQRIKDFLWQHYFRPLHQDIGSLLRTKLYLLEGGELPDSFARYLVHVTQEVIQHQLWSEVGVDTSGVPGRPWPEKFHADVKDALDRLMEEYQSGLTELGSKRR